jgi:hypothetical protein
VKKAINLAHKAKKFKKGIDWHRFMS